MPSEQRPSQSRHLYTLLAIEAQNQNVKIKGLDAAIFLAKTGMLEPEIQWVEKQVSELFDENGNFIEASQNLFDEVLHKAQSRP